MLTQTQLDWWRRVAEVLESGGEGIGIVISSDDLIALTSRASEMITEEPQAGAPREGPCWCNGPYPRDGQHHEFCRARCRAWKLFKTVLSMSCDEQIAWERIQAEEDKKRQTALRPPKTTKKNKAKKEVHGQEDEEEIESAELSDEAIKRIRAMGQDKQDKDEGKKEKEVIGFLL